MKTQSHELKHISAFTVYVQDPETGNTWGAWNNYTEGQCGVGLFTSTDDEIDTEKNRLESLGTNYWVLESDVVLAQLTLRMESLMPSQNLIAVLTLSLMSIELLNKALKLEGLTPTKKLVLVILANYADEKGSCYPSYQHIGCLLYTSPSPRDRTRSRMPSSA